MSHSKHWDAIVIGLGVVGSSALAELARSGLEVLGLDRWSPPHPQGSSGGGDTRIIRLAYAEDDAYLPLLELSYHQWRELEAEGGESILERCGCLTIGPTDGELIAGIDQTAERHGLAVERLGADEIASRFPLFRPGGDFVGRLDPAAGFLRVDPALKSLLARAVGAGAEVQGGVVVDGWERGEDGALTVRAGDRSFHADRLVVAAGAWMPRLLEPLAAHLDVRRQPVFWFEPGAAAGAEALAPDGLPTLIWEHEPRRFVYGFPIRPRGLKIAIHHEGEATTADSVDRELRDADVERVLEITERHMPGGYGALRHADVCLYTNTPDGHFVIDRHPEVPEIAFASACSGHGFKLAPAVGAALADLTLGRDCRIPLGDFSLARLTADSDRSPRRIRGGSRDFRGESR